MKTRTTLKRAAGGRATRHRNEDASDETGADSDMMFQYRPLLRIHAYRWKTSNLTQGTYQLTADRGDGVVHQVSVSLKKAR
jgi:hypothetical protein